MKNKNEKLIREAEKTNDAWRLEPDELLEKYLKKLQEKHSQEISEIFEKIEKYQAKEDKTIYSNPHLRVYREKGTIFITKEQWEKIKNETTK